MEKTFRLGRMAETKFKNNLGGQRVTIYDWVRLLATFFVVIGHSTYLNMQTSYGGVAYELPSTVSSSYYSVLLTSCRYAVEWIYGFHMPLFFMLSGAVLALKPVGQFSTFCKGKIHRWVIPYFVYGWLFMLPVKYVGGFYTAKTLKLAFRGFLVGIDSGHLWFLTALFWCMIIFSIFIKGLKRLDVQSNILILVGAGAIHFAAVLIPVDILSFKQGLTYIFWFAVGYVFESERRKHHWNWNGKKVVLSFAALTVVEVIDFRYKLLGATFTIICSSIWTYLLAWMCDNYLRRVCSTKLWKILIKNLFYVYLFHDPLEYIVLKIFMSNEFLNYSIGCYVYTAFRIVGVFVISIIMGALVTYVKGVWKDLDLLKRIRLRKKR